MVFDIPRNFSGILILTAGIPLSTPQPQTYYKGIDRIVELSLDGMEVEFVHGVRTRDDELIRMSNYAKERGVILTVHAPYYINLNAREKDKYLKSKEHVIKSMIAAEKLGAWSVAIHPAFYLGDDPKEVLGRVTKAFEEINIELDKLGHKFNVWMRPETMGKPTQFGSLEEVVELSKLFPNVLPCIDFGHLQARTNGGYSTKDDIIRAIEYVYKNLGDVAINNMHVHLEGIVYGVKGEKYHSTFEETGFRYDIILEVLREFNCNGVVVSESSNVEEDAIIMKKYLLGDPVIWNGRV